MIYATYSTDGEPVRFIVEQLNAYRQLDFEVLLVDTSGNVGEARAADWELHAAAWFQRKNEGYDFGSYQAGLRYLLEYRQLEIDASEVIFTNDSCYGPEVSMADVLTKLRGQQGSGQLTVYGMTDSYERHYHLQSYWLYFRPDVLPLARNFLDGLKTIADRDEAIEKGELALSAFLLEQGCSLLPYCKTASIVDELTRRPNRVWTIIELATRRLLKMRPRYSTSGDNACIKHLLGKPDAYAKINPTLDFGPQLYVSGMLPFIKRRLLKENPNGSTAIATTAALTDPGNEDIRRMMEDIPTLKRERRLRLDLR